jgi:hypothetical protein
MKTEAIYAKTEFLKGCFAVVIGIAAIIVGALIIIALGLIFWRL